MTEIREVVKIEQYEPGSGYTGPQIWTDAVDRSYDSPTHQTAEYWRARAANIKRVAHKWQVGDNFDYAYGGAKTRRVVVHIGSSGDYLRIAPMGSPEVKHRHLAISKELLNERASDIRPAPFGWEPVPTTPPALTEARVIELIDERIKAIKHS